MIKNILTQSEELLATTLFNNSFLKIGKQPVFLRHWYKKGVSLIGNLIKENGEFYTEKDFIQRFQLKTNFLEYHGLIKALNLFEKKA